MTNREAKRLLRAILSYLLPFVLYGLAWFYLSEGPDPCCEAAFPDAVLFYAGFFPIAGMLVLLVSIAIRFVLRRDWLPDNSARAFCCGLVAIGCTHLGLFLALGPFELLVAEFIPVSIFPFWNGTDTPSEQQCGRWKTLLRVFLGFILAIVFFVLFILFLWNFTEY